MELLAKIHGLLNDKLDITLDRKTLQRDVTEAMGELAQLHARKSLLPGNGGMIDGEGS